MRTAATIAGLLLLLTNGCLLQAMNDRKLQEAEWRHQERMRELQLQERLQDKQYLQVGDGGLVRDNPF
jgi:hypothetical protein